MVTKEYINNSERSLVKVPQTQPSLVKVPQTQPDGSIRMVLIAKKEISRAERKRKIDEVRKSIGGVSDTMLVKDTIQPMFQDTTNRLIYDADGKIKAVPFHQLIQKVTEVIQCGEVEQKSLTLDEIHQEYSLENKYGFMLSRVIMSNPFTGVIVYGKQGKGKTVYSMKVARDIYAWEAHTLCKQTYRTEYDRTKEEWIKTIDKMAWESVFEHMFFKLTDLMDYLIKHISDPEPCPVLIWDDAGVHGNKMLYFRNKKGAELLQNLFDVIRSATRGLIMTTPNPNNLLASIRNYDFMRIPLIKSNDPNKRHARIYDKNTMVGGKEYFKKMYEDVYSIMLPNDVYNRYVPIRKSYFKEALLNLKTAMEENNIEANVKELEELGIDYTRGGEIKMKDEKNEYNPEDDNIEKILDLYNDR